MRFTIASIILALTPLIAQEPSDWQGWLNQGAAAYKNGRYQEAIAAFQKAVDLNPNDAKTHSYLATALTTSYIPGAASPENLDFARRAEIEFQRVLELDPNNVGAALAMASLAYIEASGIQNPADKSNKLDEARDAYQRVLTIDPQEKTAYYSLGVIDWQQVYPVRMASRNQIGMRPEEPGPITIPTVRLILRNKFDAIIDDGISNLQRALQIDPQYDDAMAYMNLLIRERADLQDTPEEYRDDIALAEGWVQKALETKKMRAAAGGQGIWMTRTGKVGASLSLPAITAPPPPPPPPPSSDTPGGSAQRLRVSGDIQAAKLITKVDSVYPQLAAQARIQGIVRFVVTIGKDGSISNLQLVSGHPLLVEAARQAVSQYLYRPTLLNGNPVEVVTMVEVNFTLGSN